MPLGYIKNVFYIQNRIKKDLPLGGLSLQINVLKLQEANLCVGVIVFYCSVSSTIVAVGAFFITDSIPFLHDASEV